MNYKLKQKILATTSAVCLTAGITLPFFVNTYRPVPEKVSLQKGEISFYENSDVEIALERLKKEQSEKNIAQSVMKRPEFMASIKVDDTGIYYVVGNRAINVLDFKIGRKPIKDSKGRFTYEYYFYAKDKESCFDVWLNKEESFPPGNIDMASCIMQLGSSSIKGEYFLNEVVSDNLNLHRLMLYFDPIPYAKYVINHDKTELHQIFLSCGLSEEECSLVESTISKNGSMSGVMPVLQKYVAAKISTMDYEISSMASILKFLWDFSLFNCYVTEDVLDVSHEAKEMEDFIRQELDQKYMRNADWYNVKQLKNRYGILYQAWLDGEVLRVSSLELNERENGLVRTHASYYIDELYLMDSHNSHEWYYQPEDNCFSTTMKDVLEIPYVRNKVIRKDTVCTDPYIWHDALHNSGPYMIENPADYGISLEHWENETYYHIGFLDMLFAYPDTCSFHLEELYVVQTEHNTYLLDTIPENGHIAANTHFDYLSLRLIRSEEDVYDVKTLADYMKEVSLEFKDDEKIPLLSLGLDETKTYEGKYTLSLSNE